MTIIKQDEKAKEVGRYDEPAVTQARDGLLAEGIVVLEGVVALKHIEILREKMIDDLEALLSRRDRPSNWVRGNVQQNPPPIPPFLFRDILLNEFAIQVTSSVLGKNLQSTMYTGNTALPSEERQPVHSDIGHLFRDLPQAHPPYMLVINVPLVDVAAANGSTEIWPGSHLDPVAYIDDGNIEISEDKLAERRRFAPPVQPTVSAGSMVIRDIRLWHAGMPNRTQTPRPMIAMAHSVGWFTVGAPLAFPRGTESFFEHPVLKTHAVFVEGALDYIHSSHAYKAPAEGDKSTS